MERMEVEASGGGGALRRSNSAPLLLPGPCGTPPRKQQEEQEPAGPPRSRRTSVCLDSSGMAAEAVSEALPRLWGSSSSRDPPSAPQGGGSSSSSSNAGPGTSYGFSSPPSAVTPHSWHLQRLPSSPLENLKRKGGLDIDSPPKKLFVAGVPITPPAP